MIEGKRFLNNVWYETHTTVYIRSVVGILRP